MLIRQRLGYLVFGIQGRVDAAVALRGSKKTLCKHVWDLNSLTGRVIARLGKGINFSAPTTSAVSPTGDSLRSLEEGWLRWANEDRLGASLHRLVLVP